MARKHLYYTLFTLSSIIAIFSYNSISKVYEKRNVLNVYIQKIKDLKKENTKLSSELAYKKTDEFVINEARLKLNYGFKNEITYVVPKNFDPKEDSKKETSSKGHQREPHQVKNFDSSAGTPVYLLWVRAFF